MPWRWLDRPVRSALALLACICLMGISGCQEPAPSFHGIDVTGAEYARDFRLRDVDGQERSLADFKGRVTLVFFGFTQCPDVCPTALARAAEIRRLLGEDGKRLQVLFVTVDPERDKPDMLRQYVTTFDPSFVALYGDLPTTRRTADEFKVFYQKVPTGSSYTMDHTALSYVFDAKGRLRLLVKPSESVAECVEDVKRLLDTTRS